MMTKNNGSHFDYEKHPSWGMVEFSRVSGGKSRLFGSSLPMHGTTIRLTIRHGQRAHSLGSDWFMGSSRVPLVEVELSPAQFAELLTTMNIGDGVPCTIRSVDGEQMPDVPDEPMETGRVRESFKEEVGDITERLAALLKSANETLARPTLRASDRKDLIEQLRMIVQGVKSNLPFMLAQFEEATDKITTTAKAEVDAFVTHAATRLGIERLREMALGTGGDDAQPRELTNGEKGK
jgi:hypothetical protein